MSDSLPNLTELSTIVTNDKNFVLRIVQPGLAGLMDGSVSTLAPIFATRNSHTVFLIGAASVVSAGISMAFSEGLSDDGAYRTRQPYLLRHCHRPDDLPRRLTPYSAILIPNVHTALVWAYFVVGIELIPIALIRHRYFKTSFALSILQVVVGGCLVFAAAVIIGQS